MNIWCETIQGASAEGHRPACQHIGKEMTHVGSTEKSMCYPLTNVFMFELKNLLNPQIKKIQDDAVVNIYPSNIWRHKKSAGFKSKKNDIIPAVVPDPVQYHIRLYPADV